MKVKLKKMSKKCAKVLLTIILVWIIVTIGFAIKNKINASYESLDVTNQKVLNEIATYCQSYKDNEVWAGYNLNNQTFLAVNGRFGEGYLINPKKELNSTFATEIKLPDIPDIKVYRIAAMSPLLYRTYGIGKFNGINEKIVIGDNSVFYLRYNEKDNINLNQFSSSHLVVLLSHEAFHNSVQNKWGNEDLGGRFETDTLNNKEQQILANRYDILQKIQEEIWKESPDHNEIKKNIRLYVKESEELKKNNPTYFKDETMTETFEGTANYVSAKAAKVVNYPYNVTSYTDSSGNTIKHIPFDHIIPYIKSKKMDISSISTDWVYSSGGLWCEVLEELGDKNWQEILNNQTTESPITLYDLVKKIVY